MATKGPITGKGLSADNKSTGAAGQTFEALSEGFLLVNGVTLVCCCNGGTPMDFGPNQSTSRSDPRRPM